MDHQEIRELIESLFSSQPFGVLATCSGEEPHTSLMAFVAGEELSSLVFVTDRHTQKYSNLTSNPRTAFLIDNRPDHSGHTQRACAVSALGEAHEIEGPDRERWMERYARRHPHLEDFARSPSSALMRLDVQRYSVVGGLGESRDVEIGELSE